MRWDGLRAGSADACGGHHCGPEDWESSILIDAGSIWRTKRYESNWRYKVYQPSIYVRLNNMVHRDVMEGRFEKIETLVCADLTVDKWNRFQLQMF